MIRIRDIIYGALTRTAPGVLAGFALLASVSPYVRAHFTFASLGPIVTATLAVAAGSSLSLLAMRSRLRPDAAVGGRRAFIVGLAAFGAGMTARPFLSFVNPAGEYLLMAASGAVLGAAMFFPWIESRTAASAVAAAGDQEHLLQEPLPSPAHTGSTVQDHDLT